MTRPSPNCAANLGRIAFMLTALSTGHAGANNGLNLIGYGAQSMAMGGADTATVVSPAALNINPAALPRQGQALEMTGAVAVGLNNGHADALGNDVDNDQPYATLASGGYTRTFGAFTVGFGLFVQGGAGSQYDSVRTPFNTRDELSAMMAVVRLTPGVAWQLSPSLSLGVAIPLNVAQVEQKVFPETSTPLFAGVSIKRGRAVAPSVKTGFLYHIGERVRLAGTYSSKAKLDFEDARLTANFAAQGLGKVRYSDTTLSGVNLPQQAGLGIAVDLTPRLTIAADIDWLDWSDAVKRSRVVARKPSSSLAPATLELASTLNWRDQIVFALGTAYVVNDSLVLRAGYNYGRSPIPGAHVQPLLAPISEQEITLGLGLRLAARWRMESALQWQVNRNQRYSNPESPLGAPAEERVGYLGVHLSVIREW